MPLDVLVELQGPDGDEVLEADGLDVSPGGMSMRASFVPPLGARLACQFRCPPQGDPVQAAGEVVWAEWTGPRTGAFGMRFLELDTKSATAIRRYLEPDFVAPAAAPAEDEPQRVATMRIDGLGAPIEADVAFADAGRVVLEQELSFLKLGRALELDVPARGKQRGRIGSIELKHSALGVPTLVFGILLDELEQEAPARSADRAADRGTTTSARELASSAQDEARADEIRTSEQAEAPLSPSDTWPEAPAFAARAAEARASVESDAVASEPKLSARKAVTAPVAKKSKRELDEPTVIVTEAAADADPELEALAQRLPSWLLVLKRLLVTWLASLRTQLGPTRERVRSELAKAKGEGWPVVRERSVALFAAARSQLHTFVARVRLMQKTRAEAKRRTTSPAPAPRVQRSAQAPAAKPAPKAAPPRNRRLYAVGLAMVGVALGVYALAPRSGADRIRVPREVQRPSAPEELTTTPVMPTIAPVSPSAAMPASATSAPLAAAPIAASAPMAPVNVGADPAIAPSAPGKLSFGEAAVANGRTFVLRMSGPVESVEGDARDDGFTVRVPGRLALDRASPIATSHRGVARAMILNRGDYAELTVDFLPGMHPKYQVIGKDNTIEVTLERE